MLLFFGIIALLYFTINPSNVNFMPKCPLYATTGIYCPGCGSQRALHDILHLNFKGVIRHNLLFLVGILVLIYHFTIEGLLFFTNRKVNNLLYHPKTPIILLVLIIIYWVLRNIPIYPFTLLAPSK